MTDALIVLTNRRLAATVSSLVYAEGLRPVIVRDGLAALARLAEHEAPTLLVTALSLPGVDGFEVLRELRRRSPPEFSRAVVLSPFHALRHRAFELRHQLGIHALLPTTASVAGLERSIKRVLQHPSERAAPVVHEESHLDEEHRRLSRLATMGLAETSTNLAVLEQICADTARRYGVGGAFVSLVLRDRQRIEAFAGVAGRLAEQGTTQRDWSFCTHPVEGHAPLLVPDATNHPEFRDNPLVTAGLLRGYAGAPLVTPTGEALGALCLLDTKPLTLDAEAFDQLTIDARRVAGELVLFAESHAAQPARPIDAAMVAPHPMIGALLDHVDDGLLLLDGDRRVVVANRALGELFELPRDRGTGLTRDELLGLQTDRFDDPEMFLTALRVPSEGPYAARDEFEMQRPVRRVVRWVEKPLRFGDRIYHLATFTDVTAEADLVRERDRLARTDHLTGLANRRAAEEALSREGARVARSGALLSVVLFDIDYFKKVNDTAGHAVGDETLRAVARAILTAGRKADLVSRWGGEEFLALLPDVGEDGARAYAERARLLVGELLIEGAGRITISAGVARLGRGDTIESLLARADARLYEAKSSGRNRVV